MENKGNKFKTHNILKNLKILEKEECLKKKKVGMSWKKLKNRLSASAG